MADIYFKCECNKSLAVDQQGVGHTIECPDCHKPVTVPAPDFRAACDHCGNEALLPNDMVNQEVQCVKCERFFQAVPMITSEASRAPAPAPPPPAPRRAQPPDLSNVFKALTSIVVAAVVVGLIGFYLKHMWEVNTDSRNLGEVIEREAASTDYHAAIAALGAAYSNYPQARNRAAARDLMQRMEQSIKLADALDSLDAVVATNLGQALETLIQTVHYNPQALNRHQAESRLSQMRIDYAEKLQSDRAATMQAMELVNVMHSVRQMGDLPQAIKILEDALKSYPAATNRMDATRLLEQMQLSFNQTEELSKSMAAAESESRYDLRRAIDLLSDALRQNPKAVNRDEAETMMARWKKKNIESAIALQKQQKDSLALVQAVEKARKAGEFGDLKASVRILEDALQAYPDATNRMEVTTIIARIARGEKDTGARAGFDGALALSPSWHYGAASGSRSADDMRALLDSLGEPKVDARSYPSLVIYKQVTYLMPLEEAVQVLFPGKGAAPKRSVSTPGFPENSFFYYRYDGVFEEIFNRLLLVVDTHNQVVAVQLVEENPPKDIYRREWFGSGSREYSLFDIIQNRTKSSSTTKVFWKNMTFLMQPQLTSDNDPAAAAGQLTHVLEGGLVDGKDNRTKERTRLYLPQPMVNLILFKLSGARYTP